MDSIAKNPQWLSAQVPFAELSEEIRSNPLIISGDTAVFQKEPCAASRWRFISAGPGRNTSVGRDQQPAHRARQLPQNGDEEQMHEGRAEENDHSHEKRRHTIV
jgi:hypothetical protein